MKAFAYDTYEYLETIWIKPKNSFCSFPYFDLEGYHKIDFFKTEIKAPLELVLDNFTEVEHTPSVHLFLGYDSSRISEIQVETFTEEDSVRIKNIGPQKIIPSLIRYFLDLKKKNLFVDDWTTYFSPVYSVYDQYWIEENQKNKNQFRIYVFFTPINSHTTQLFSFTYLKYSRLGHLGLNLLIQPFLKQIVRLEILRDKTALEKIENQDISLKGLKLTRFDKSLGPNRARIQKIYKGN
jgi:vanillate O-demethylase monooxygenase subunit